MIKSPDRFYVYALFRQNGQPFYIGKGSNSRLSAHLNERRKNGRCKNPHKAAIIEGMISAGLDVPRVKIRTGLTEREAFAIEAAFINALGRWPDGPLVNLTAGGEGWAGGAWSEKQRQILTQKGRKHTPETRARMSEAQKGRPGTRSGAKLTEAHKERLRAANIGNTHAAGRSPSLETRQKIAAAMRGRAVSEACVAAVKIANTGKKHTDETRAKVSEALRGNQHTKSRKISEAHRAALMAGHAKLKGRPGRKLTPEEIEKRTATMRANRSPDTIAKRSAIMAGRPQSPEHIAARMAGKAAAKARREAEKGKRA